MWLPSAETARPDQLPDGSEVDCQVAPASDESSTGAFQPLARMALPSPDNAIDAQMRPPEVVSVQVEPPSCDTQRLVKKPAAARARPLRATPSLNQPESGARGVHVAFPKPLKTCWPAFCATRQPPVPTPETSTTSPSVGEVGSVIATDEPLSAR